MPISTKSKIKIYLMLFLLVVGFAVWNRAWSVEYINVSSQTGVWDLRDFDFFRHNAILTGPVEFIPDALLTPEEFSAREAEVQIGFPEDAGQYATSRIRVLLPENQSYTLDVQSIDFAERLYVNGEWFWDIGKPGDTKMSTVPDTAGITFIAKPQNGVIEIVQQGANFVHRESGGHNGWHVGLPGLSRMVNHRGLEIAVIAGCYLALFIVHMMLYFLLTQYRGTLYFSLFCLMWFLRSGITGPSIFSSLFPLIPWTVKFRIEYLAFPVTAALFVLMLDMFYPRILQKKFRYSVYFVSAVFTALFLFADTLYMSYALPVLEVLYGAAILYILFCVLRKLRNPTTEQTIFILGGGLFLVSALWDMLYYNNIIRFTLFHSEFSMLIFTFFAAAAVFVSTVREVENAKEQERLLATENSALDRINRMRSNMMATISHEMRTPLTVMSVYAQLTMKTLQAAGADEQTTADLKMISTEAKRLAEMATGFLSAVNEQERADIHSPMDIAPVLLQASHLIKPTLEKNQNHLTVDIVDELPLILCNAGECMQLLWNLLTNAAKHTQNGWITIEAWAKDGYVFVEVSDTGAGIEPERLARLFERQSNTPDGGLGLIICKEIMDAQGGAIEIESELGKGTKVILKFSKYRGEPYG